MNASEVMDEQAPGWSPMFAVQLGKRYRGVFLAAPETIMGLSKIPKTIEGDGWIYYEVRHFLRECLTGKESMLRLLSQPESSYLLLNEQGRKLILLRDAIIEGDQMLVNDTLIRLRASQLPNTHDLQAQLANAKDVIRTLYRQVASSTYRFGAKAIEKNNLMQTMEDFDSSIAEEGD